MQEWRRSWLKIYPFGCKYTIWFVWVSVTVSATAGEAWRYVDGLTWAGVDPHSWQGTCSHSGQSLEHRNHNNMNEHGSKRKSNQDLIFACYKHNYLPNKQKSRTSQLLFCCKHFLASVMVEKPYFKMEEQMSDLVWQQILLLKWQFDTVPSHHWWKQLAGQLRCCAWFPARAKGRWNHWGKLSWRSGCCRHRSTRWSGPRPPPAVWHWRCRSLRTVSRGSWKRKQEGSKTMQSRMEMGT